MKDIGGRIPCHLEDERSQLIIMYSVVKGPMNRGNNTKEYKIKKGSFM